MKETKTNRPMLTFEDRFGRTGLSKAQLCLTGRPRISDTHSHQTWTWDNGFWVHRPMPMEINAADSHGDKHSRSRLYKKSDNLKQGEKQREGEIPKVWVGLLREERKCWTLLSRGLYSHGRNWMKAEVIVRLTGFLGYCWPSQLGSYNSMYVPLAQPG